MSVLVDITVLMTVTVYAFSDMSGIGILFMTVDSIVAVVVIII